jgi:hypothetical protein
MILTQSIIFDIIEEIKTDKDQIVKSYIVEINEIDSFIKEQETFNHNPILRSQNINCLERDKAQLVDEYFPELFVLKWIDDDSEMATHEMIIDIPILLFNETKRSICQTKDTELIYLIDIINNKINETGKMRERVSYPNISVLGINKNIEIKNILSSNYNIRIQFNFSCAKTNQL